MLNTEMTGCHPKVKSILEDVTESSDDEQKLEESESHVQSRKE